MNENGRKNENAIEKEIGEDQGVIQCRHHQRDIIKRKRREKQERRNTAAHKALTKKVIRGETLQIVRKKRRNPREVNDTGVWTTRIVKVQITKKARRRRRNMLRKKMMKCLMEKREEMKGKKEAKKKKVEMKDTAKKERTEMIDDPRRNHEATRRSLSVQAIMIVTVISDINKALKCCERRP